MKQKFWADKRGATSIEYGVIVAVIGLAVIVGGSMIRDRLSATLQQFMAGGDSMSVENCASGSRCKPDSAGERGGSTQSIGVR